ncbi:orotidine 5'-phosphate decarboxylase [Candidatus Curtissbacteria bacterium RIFCSPHIGHO2_12_FULL_38_9b]|uniref:Orotidine-5'-phosphate decarboxylase n=2 Tax=Candidatus Curtissiibacteriota TaxID=1752717 RepID=A0A1F5GSU9_9BACT|nr:MAG: orotidine 5'-phosphate decarboxylase [Candidatus Curtissbacteria bacterium RIFCSPHIGHO2_12_FULL_38_9b]OGD95309.1 MAG: orotidine 5'-phosphate decarboxylase [Candidatus Curtissbacteria bacterium RIFCSPLOWO2_01_FULL_37_9]
MNFTDKLQKAVSKNNSLLCVGLDPHPFQGVSFKGSESLLKFNQRVIDQTSDFVCAYKPNIAFFEAAGLEGLEALFETISYLKNNFPHLPIVLDAKRADVPHTAKMYAKSVFEYWQADAVTVYPHLGLDSIEPFLEYKDKLTILLIKTSNPDSVMFQDLKTPEGPYFLAMAERIKSWQFENIGIFAPATYPKELKVLRAIFPDKIFLSAGIGIQKGVVKAAVKAGTDINGTGIMFNASRSIIFNDNPQKAAKNLRDEINKYR